MTEDNIASMVELAQANGIAVILASIPPVAAFPWRPGLETRRPIAEINGWLRDFARERGLVYADYWSALQDGQGGMSADNAYDGVHPTDRGYQLMRPLAEAALRTALGR